MKKTQNSNYSGFFLTLEPERTKWVAERIGVYEITDSFSSIDIKLSKREVAFLSLSEDVSSITHMALYEKMRGNGGSAKIKMRIIELCTFEPPVQLGMIGLKQEHILTPETINRCNYSKWTEVISELFKIYPDKKAEIERLLLLQKPQFFTPWESERGKILNEERDGIGLALDIAGIERKSVFSKIREEKLTAAECIINAIDDADMYEIDMLNYDKQIFASILNETSEHYAKFSDGKNNSVRIHITDKTKIETVIGVDLIIVDLKHNNYLLLQYKRMEKTDADGWKYNVTESSNISEQLLAMTKVIKAANNDDSTYKETADIWDYRLNDNPFYFKFCEGMTHNSSKDALTPGITIGYDYIFRHFNVLHDSEQRISGSIGYFNCKKYFCNTEFIILMREGWIGGNYKYSHLLSKLLASNKKEGRRAMLAIIESPKDAPKQGRNSIIRAEISK